MRYPPPCSGGHFCNRGARCACTLSSRFFPVSHRFSLSPPFPKQQYIPILVRAFSVARSWERSTKVGEEVNELDEILFLQVMSPNLIVGR